jgi:UDP-glucose 4-epimerase
MTSVLVTGATTPFGLALVESLSRAPSIAHVLAVGREARFPARASSKLTYVPLDLTRERDVRDLLFGPARALNVETVVHGAHHRSVRTHGRAAHALQVEATRQMLELAERHPSIRRFVYTSSAEVYRRGAGLPAVISEESAVELSRDMPQRLRDRVEADLTVCARSGLSRCEMIVLRFAELLAPDCGSQLADYLGSRVCLRALGFDPMIEALSLEDAVRATEAAITSTALGVVNVPGADVLPLTAAIEAAGRTALAVPSSTLELLYAARAVSRRTEFTWRMNRWRFRWGGVLDGSRARDVLGYVPRVRVDFAAVARAGERS